MAGPESTFEAVIHNQSRSGPPLCVDVNSCASERVRLFIVEDSPVILDNLTATLEELAPVVVVGSAVDESAAKLWLLAPENHWDVVIIDIFLKAGSGLGVLRATGQSQSDAHHHPIGKQVVLTNYATDDMRERCRVLGADRVFDKSNEIDGLIEYCTELASGNVCTESKQ
jgi:DNA-binding NarL/FixJ family response regulator